MHGAILDEKVGAQVRELRFHVAGHQFDKIKYLNFWNVFILLKSLIFLPLGFFYLKQIHNFLWPPIILMIILLSLKLIGKKYFA